MRLTSLIALIILVPNAWASRTSYHNAHPVGWMHLLPVGEMPGWSQTVWAELELNHANVWNMDFEMTDNRSGNIYRYKADFEQSSAIVNMGAALSERWALSFEMPYANRNGGFLDEFIDQFHELIQSDRFFRHLNEEFGNEFLVQTNGVDMLATSKGEGVGSVKTKLKYWLWKKQGVKPSSCDCGFAISGQVKVPTQARKFGLSSGDTDYSLLTHLGYPLGKQSAVWSTVAFTRLGNNQTFAGWPRRNWAQMYELSFDFGIGETWGVLMQGRLESPLFNESHLNYNYTYTEEKSRKSERVASGFNSLTAWRGSQLLGVRWRWGKGHQGTFSLVEDWWIGNRDGRKDFLYVTNAPDVAFISHWSFVF